VAAQLEASQEGLSSMSDTCISSRTFAPLLSQRLRLFLLDAHAFVCSCLRHLGFPSEKIIFHVHKRKGIYVILSPISASCYKQSKIIKIVIIP
jgi:hypothetical protein